MGEATRDGYWLIKLRTDPARSISGELSVGAPHSVTFRDRSIRILWRNGDTNVIYKESIIPYENVLSFERVYT